MKISMKKMLLTVLTSGLSVACTPVVPPVEQVQQVQAQAVNQQTAEESNVVQKVSVAKNRMTTLYVCKDDVVVRVQQVKAKKTSKRTVQNSIIVTYGNTSHNLSPAVTQNGKKYSNIRWIWRVPSDGKPTLTDNSDNVLAEECVIKW